MQPEDDDRERVARGRHGRSPALLGGRFEDVLAAARAGDEQAWTTIYRKLAPAVLGYLRTQGAPDAEDLTGEVFVQLVRGLPRFAGDERGFRAWTFTIAHRRLVDDRRGRGRRSVEPPSAHATDAAAATSRAGRSVGVAQAEAHAPSAEVQSLARVQAERIRAQIDELPAEQRTVLLLRIVGDLTVREVALAVGKRSGAVKALQRRGLAKLRRALVETGAVGEPPA